MEQYIPLLAGIVHKVYDDITDNKITLLPLHDDLLKVAMVCLMTVLFLQNPTTSAFFLIVIVIYWQAGKIDCDFWKACIPIPIITTVVNYDKFFFVSWLDSLQRLFFIVLVGLAMFVEDKMFPEETSFNKTYSRIILIGVFGFTVWLTHNFSARGFIHSCLLFGIGYIIANIAFHTIHSEVKDTDVSQATPTE